MWMLYSLLMSASHTTQGFRYYGMTDDTTTCDQCGRTELKRTIILMTLDADGNDDGLVYFGSSCAARALATRFGVRTTASKVLREAENAEYLRRQNRTYALGRLAHYGVAVGAEPTRDVMVQYRVNNRMLNGTYPSFADVADHFALWQTHAAA